MLYLIQFNSFNLVQSCNPARPKIHKTKYVMPFYVLLLYFTHFPPYCLCGYFWTQIYLNFFPKKRYFFQLTLNPACSNILFILFNDVLENILHIFFIMFYIFLDNSANTLSIFMEFKISRIKIVGGRGFPHTTWVSNDQPTCWSEGL